MCINGFNKLPLNAENDSKIPPNLYKKNAENLTDFTPPPFRVFGFPLGPRFFSNLHYFFRGFLYAHGTNIWYPISGHPRVDAALQRLRAIQREMARIETDGEAAGRGGQAAGREGGGQAGGSGDRKYVTFASKHFLLILLPS